MVIDSVQAKLVNFHRYVDEHAVCGEAAPAQAVDLYMELLH